MQLFEDGQIFRIISCLLLGKCFATISNSSGHADEGGQAQQHGLVEWRARRILVIRQGRISLDSKAYTVPFPRRQEDNLNSGK